MRHKLINRTNRTIECPLPGKGWIRLLPGEHCDLTDAQAATPKVSQLLRRTGVVLGKAGRAETALEATTAKSNADKPDATPASRREVALGPRAETDPRPAADERAASTSTSTRKPGGGTNDNG
jgi:hypothetical protein